MGNLLGRRRAVRAARRLLGRRPAVVGHVGRRDPMLEIDGHRLWYRRKADAYFRLVVACHTCGSDVVWRGPELRTWADVVAASPPAVSCRSCRRAATTSEPIALRAEHARNRLRVIETH